MKRYPQIIYLIQNVGVFALGFAFCLVLGHSINGNLEEVAGRITINGLAMAGTLLAWLVVYNVVKKVVPSLVVAGCDLAWLIMTAKRDDHRHVAQLLESKAHFLRDVYNAKGNLKLPENWH